MRLQILEPWIIAAALGLLCGLCWHISDLDGHIADLLRLYALRSRPDPQLCGSQRRWRELRRLYLALAASCAVGALCFVAIALGWA